MTEESAVLRKIDSQMDKQDEKLDKINERVAKMEKNSELFCCFVEKFTEIYPQIIEDHARLNESCSSGDRTRDNFYNFIDQDYSPFKRRSSVAYSVILVVLALVLSDHAELLPIIKGLI
ncbi:MAG: hypothetical protein PHQ43_09695 [Dehalococcoidales bacterium]|nr:hypothetical protein [Dehalococcoidales bacterium]